MRKQELSKEILDLLNNVTNKRARFLIDTIIEKGYCSTEDLKNAGYEHGPRAARDVRELGIPLKTENIKSSNGKTIAAYTLGDFEEVHKSQVAKTGGRTQLTNKLKEALAKKYGCRCYLYGEEYPLRLLQPDHRVPYEIGGDPENMMDTDYFMLLCPSANRDKSYACEHCKNWKEKKVEFCKKCYYAFPEKYEHIAGVNERRVDLTFQGNDVEIYEKIKIKANDNHMIINEYVKSLLKKSL